MHNYTKFGLTKFCQPEDSEVTLYSPQVTATQWWASWARKTWASL